MNEQLELLARVVLIGAGGSAFIDAWSLVLRRVFHIPTLDYALLGRWIGHFRYRRFVHARITAAVPLRGERLLGWMAHYGIGVGFAVLLLALAGADWATSPTLLPALVVGVGSVVAPWFVMQPAFGAGIAGARTPNPAAGRLRNLGTHTVYGVGLYVTALAISSI
jgi:hypothetical protein